MEGRLTEKENTKKKRDLPPTGSFPRQSRQLELVQNNVSSLNLRWDLSYGWRSAQPWPTAFLIALARGCTRNLVARTWTFSMIWGVDILSIRLICYPPFLRPFYIYIRGQFHMHSLNRIILLTLTFPLSHASSSFLSFNFYTDTLSIYFIIKSLTLL